MESHTEPRDVPLAFGPFEWRAEGLELRRKGVRVRLSGQPAEILQALLREPGRLVTRDELRRLSLERAEYCDLYWDPPTSSATWTGYLTSRARRSLEQAGGDFATIDPAALAEPFDQEPERGFLHFDCYPHNILVEGLRVSAIIDFGGMCMSGDPRFDPLTAAIYLGAGARSEDRLGVRQTCREWLNGANLLHWLDGAEQLVAAIWSFAQDDPIVAKWSRRVLLGQVDL
jgi:Ser/Thr protein kinase RdoA (MazF antagonist)